MDVEIEQPHPHHATGHPWLDKILPVSALFVSFVSILIAFHHGKIMQQLVHQNERLVQANSLPHLQFYSNDSSDRIQLVVANAGVGPAEIKSVQTFVKGKPVATIEELLRQCCGATGRSGVGKATLRGSMLRPGDSMNYLTATQDFAPTVTQPLLAAYARGDIESKVCYCSVFDDCWTRSSLDRSRGISPKPVDACPMPQPQYRS